MDILLIGETKLDNTFPDGQFLINGFLPPFRKDRNKYGGGIMILVKEQIPVKIIETNLPNDIESIFLELSFKNSKWLLIGAYRPPTQCANRFYSEINKEIEKNRYKYENLILMGDLNETVDETNTKTFMEDNDLKSLIKDYTCYKNPNNPRCIDHILTNQKLKFKNSCTFDCGLSDFHRLIVTSFRFTFSPGAPKQVFYRSYKKFDDKKFKSELKLVIKDDTDFDTFNKHFIQVLDKYAPIKQKTVRANNQPYMTKALRKAMMKRTELANKYHKHRKDEDYTKFRKQRNYVNRLYKKERRNYFNNLQKNDLEDIKSFWKTVKPLISDKCRSSNNIKITKDGCIIESNQEMAEEFNSKFANIVSDLNISFNWNTDPEIEAIKDPIQRSIKKYQNHPSILKIKEKYPNPNMVDFKETQEEQVIKIVKEFDIKRGSSFGSIPGKVIKDNKDIIKTKVTQILNTENSKSVFANELKKGDINPAFKPGKKNRMDIGNYRPLSVLPYLSKIPERVLKTQLMEQLEHVLNPNLCGYRKGFSTQHALISMLEKWKQQLDKKGYAGAVLMDLSKAFDCINHELLIAKLDAYGLTDKALRMISSYISERWQRTKVNGTFSNWSKLLVGVPQGSVLGPILFNIYLNDLLWVIEDCCNFADDTTIYACNKDLNVVKSKLETNSKKAIQWFKENYMKLNEDKCKLIICGKKNENISVKVGSAEIWEEQFVTLLGICIDNKLSFDKYISKIVKKANGKIAVIQRSFRYLSKFKRNLLLNSFVQSQFSYAPLVWMMHSKLAERKINKTHEKFLRLLHDDYQSNFKELLDKEGTYTVHEMNMKKLLIEMYKAKNKTGPSLLIDIFPTSSYEGPSLRKPKDFMKRNIETQKYGERSLNFFGTNLWRNLPEKIRMSNTLEDFKREIKNWKPEKCFCYLCKNFIQDLGIAETCDNNCCIEA